MPKIKLPRLKMQFVWGRGRSDQNKERVKVDERVFFVNPQQARGDVGIQIAQMCVSTPLCNAWAVTHYIENKEQGKHALVV